MIEPLHAFLEGIPKPLLLIIGVALVVVVGGLNLFSGIAMNYALLYLIPIALVSWYVGGTAGSGVAFLSLFYGLNAALMTYRQSASFPVLWDNLLIPGAVFFLTASAVAQLRRKLDNLSQIATRDFLTGLPNSQAFAEITARETERCKGVDPLTLVYIDLGGLDGINHTSGHSKGDQVLCAIGQVIKQNMPRQELIGRVGGTTFAVLLPKTGTETAKAAIWQLQTQLHEARRKILLPITFSISAMTCAKAPRTVAGLLHEAETRLRRSGGRDHDALDICQVDTVSALH